MTRTTTEHAAAPRELVARVEHFVMRHGLLAAGCRCVVGVSGGADSVCLLLVLQRLGYQVEAVHCNFMLRGDESLRDEAFVRDLCLEHAIPFHTIHFDTRTYAELHRVSIEMAARELRYRHFEQLLADLDAAAICVAHHRDDQAETVLLNLLRGTGLQGLGGMKPRQGHVVRPLLCVSRQEIEQWLESQGQPFVTDSTNLVADVLRNRLRLEIIPRLQQMVPGAVTNIVRSAQWAREAYQVYEQSTQEALGELISHDTLPLARLREQPSAECILFEWLRPCGFSPATIAAIHQSGMDQGRQWLSATHRLVVHQQSLVLTPLTGQRPTLRIPETGLYRYDDATALRFELLPEPHIATAPTLASLDADKVHFPLTLRPTQEGDRFQPFGMKGTKLVSDFLTDRKCSLPEKQRQLVLTDADGRIVWLVGRRTDGRCCIDASTKKTLLVSLIQENDNPTTTP